MKPHAYYNEIDPYAALWIENLILEGVIAYGDVDRRSIEDVRPAELVGYTQCHFFAGLGGWSYALRLAGWPDERHVWTGSCPCQPFSAAGKSAGFADERHLWPAWYWLIAQCRPDTIFGEQVASPAALAWVDLVSTDLENSRYAFAPEDLCAAGIGTPHIRQRLYWVAESESERQAGRYGESSNKSLEPGPRPGIERRGVVGMADSSSTGLEILGEQQARGQRETAQRGGAAGVLGDSELPAETRQRQHSGPPLSEHESGIFGSDGSPRLLADADGGDAGAEGLQRSGQHGQQSEDSVVGVWSNCEWLPCRDGKWRPVEPGTFPLAHGVPARVGRLRAYGNAICAPLAAEFVRAYRKC